MTSQAEKFGTALAKAVKGTAASIKERQRAPVIYRANMRDVPPVEGLKREDGWVETQVQFLIDKQTADANHIVGRTVLKPGARHENHRLRHCDAFTVVLKGRGMIFTEHGDTPFSEGDVIYSPRDCWHGFNNTSNEEVVLLWGWMSVGSIVEAGYEGHPDTPEEPS